MFNKMKNTRHTGLNYLCKKYILFHKCLYQHENVPVYLHKQRVLLTPAGQLSQVGRQFYNTDIEVEILSKEETEKMTYVVRTPAQVKNPSGYRASDLDPVTVPSTWRCIHHLQ